MRSKGIRQSKHDGVEALHTNQPAVKLGVGGDLETGVGQKKAADGGEAGVNVLPDVLQLLVLVLLDLHPEPHGQQEEPNHCSLASLGSNPTRGNF